MKSNVYLSRSLTSDKDSRIAALKKLLDAVDQTLNFTKNELVPVKITIGDSPCIYHVSPELVRCVTNLVKNSGAKPFLFDTSVIYQGQRQNAVDHLNLAQTKGFSHTKAGAPFIVADGLLGQDGREIEIKDGLINKIKVPAFVGYLDSLLVLSHPTGHIVSGFAAAIKNVAMGISCKPTKQQQHSTLKPSVIGKKCTACGCCIKICPAGAISLKEGKTLINKDTCVGCAECLCACKFEAIFINWHEDPLVFVRRMDDVAAWILEQFKNKFFFNFAFDITKECDCISDKNDQIIASDIGILASQDPLALDRATVDLCLEHIQAPLLKTSKPVYEEMFSYAQKKGIGNLDYRLVEV